MKLNDQLLLNGRHHVLLVYSARIHPVNSKTVNQRKLLQSGNLLKLPYISYTFHPIEDCAIH